MEQLTRHSKVVFQFSGGKDSIAVLQMLEPWLDKITVLWMNPGDAFPETLAQMEKVRGLCANFVEVTGQVRKHIVERGFPVDVLPIHNLPEAQVILGDARRQKLHPFTECCYKNLMQPMHEATLALGATLVIRGQKAVDTHKSPIVSGSVVDGLEYWYPLEDWTDAEVYAYVWDSDLLPAHYGKGNSSLDCMHCTAYMAANQWKLPYLQKHHPEAGAEVKRRLILIKNEIMAEVANLGVCDD